MPKYWATQQKWHSLNLDLPIAKEIAYYFSRNGPTMNAGYYIHGIEMNVNHDDFEMYQLKKRSFVNKGIKPNERWGWHGTEVDNTFKIKQNGFDRDYSSGYSRQMCGVGTYFARDAEFSWNGYCKDKTLSDDTMQRFIILSRLLLGDYCKGQPNKFLKDMPLKDDGTAYNSMVGYQYINPNIYVMGTGSDNQVYPEFVIEFRNNSKK